MKRWVGNLERENHPDEIRVFVRKTKDKSSTTPHFESEVLLSAGHHKKSFFVKKDSDNFFEAVRRSVKALESRLRKDSDKGRDRHRQKGTLPGPFNFGDGTIHFEESTSTVEAEN
ncbi:MAG: hypothetical protein V4736_09965 [Bdellovibrionota bacterium]